MFYEIGVYGDSIAFGYGNRNQSWFDIIAQKFSSSIKLAQNGEKTCDVLTKLQKDNNHYSLLIFAFGVNDLLISSPDDSISSYSVLTQQYADILRIALNKTENIIIQSVLPVREELFPNQDWLDGEAWVFNKTIRKFNNALLELSENYSAIYIDAYSVFSQLSLKDVYVDAVHLNAAGQRKLSEIYNCSIHKP